MLWGRRRRIGPNWLCSNRSMLLSARGRGGNVGKALSGGIPEQCAGADETPALSEIGDGTMRLLIAMPRDRPCGLPHGTIAGSVTLPNHIGVPRGYRSRDIANIRKLLFLTARPRASGPAD